MDHDTKLSVCEIWDMIWTLQKLASLTQSQALWLVNNDLIIIENYM